MERLKGGLGDGKLSKQFKRKEVAMGMKVEMEHTNDKKIAREIVHDHLTEDPNYYSKLKKLNL